MPLSHDTRKGHSSDNLQKGPAHEAGRDQIKKNKSNAPHPEARQGLGMGRHKGNRAGKIKICRHGRLHTEWNAAELPKTWAMAAMALIIMSVGILLVDSGQGQHLIMV